MARSQMDTLLDLRNNCTRRLEEGTMTAENSQRMVVAIDRRLDALRAERAQEAS